MHTTDTSKSSTSGYSRGVQSQSHMNSSHSDRDIGGRNHAGSGDGMGTGQSGNGVKREREAEATALHLHGHGHTTHTPLRRLGRDADANFIPLDGVSAGRVGENVTVNGGQSQSRSAGSNVFVEGQQSLPSLKSVGLLAVQHPPVSMPVGLQWLANESR